MKQKLVATKGGIKISSKTKRESFKPEDKEWLKDKEEIEIDERLGNGFYGDVYSVKGNSHLAVKIPKYFGDPDASRIKNDYNGRIGIQLNARFMANKQRSIKQEAKFCIHEDTNDKPLFIPTKKMKVRCNENRTCVGIVRPIVKSVVEYNPKKESRNRLTDEQIEHIRREVIKLSHEGYVFADGLQVGVTLSGRPLAFDLGNVTYAGKVGYDNTAYIFSMNESAWEDFLYSVCDGKIDTVRYGRINRNEHY